MIERLRLRRSLSSDVAIGQVIEHDEKSFLIINIIDIRAYHPVPQKKFFIIDCLAQLIHEEDISVSQVALDITKTEIIYEANDYFKIAKVGDFLFDQNTQRWMQIEKTLKAQCKNDRLHVTYEFSPVDEWDGQRVKKSLSQHKRCIMKLLRHDENN